MSSKPKSDETKPHPTVKVCVDCGNGIAVTNDGRLCLKCLRAWIKRDSPGTTRLYGAYRSSDQRAAPADDDNPWRENATRALEESG